MSLLSSTKPVGGGPRVLFLVPSLARAGAEKQVVDLANGLSGNGLRCQLASFEANRDQLVRVDRDKVTYHPLTRSRKFDFGLVRRLARLIDDEEIEVLHCTLSISVFYGVLARALARRKPALIAGVHTTLSRNAKDEFLERWLYRWQLRSAAKVVFVCHSQMDYWLNRDPGLVPLGEVIHNGVDVGYFSPDQVGDCGDGFRAELGIPADAALACCIAAFRPEKAQGNIVRALTRLPGELAGLHVVMAGDGPERARVEDLARELDLGGRVHFTGNIPDVRPVLAAADFAIIASTAVETFSFAMLESMAMATPVLSTRIGGAGEAVLPGETGELVTPGDIQDLAGAMARLTGDLARTHGLGRQARARVEEMFSLGAMIEATGASIRETLARLAG